MLAIIAKPCCSAQCASIMFFEKNGYVSGKLTLSLPNVLSRKSGQLKKKNVPKINSHPHQSDLWTKKNTNMYMDFLLLVWRFDKVIF